MKHACAHHKIISLKSCGGTKAITYTTTFKKSGVNVLIYTIILIMMIIMMMMTITMMIILLIVVEEIIIIITEHCRRHSRSSTRSSQ